MSDSEFTKDADLIDGVAKIVGPLRDYPSARKLDPTDVHKLASELRAIFDKDAKS